MQSNVKLSTYKGSLTSLKTIMVVSNLESVGSKHYKEVHLYRKNGGLFYIITDGYKYLDIERPIRDNLKSAINIVSGKIVPTPWYCK